MGIPTGLGRCEARKMLYLCKWAVVQNSQQILRVLNVWKGDHAPANVGILETWFLWVSLNKKMSGDPSLALRQERFPDRQGVGIPIGLGSTGGEVMDSRSDAFWLGHWIRFWSQPVYQRDLQRGGKPDTASKFILAHSEKEPSVNTLWF